MYGWPVDEAARVLDCPPGTVKSRCARGRARLLPLLRLERNPDEANGVTSQTSTPAQPARGGEPT
jgi:RNA polymerase sigma-70 factor (ECF subfamily)